MASLDPSDPGDALPSRARKYLESKDHILGPDLELIEQSASTLFPSLAIDVATGPGHALRAAAPFSGICLALDVSIDMLSVAREHLGRAGLDDVAYVQAAAASLPLRDNSVSLLTCRIAPHHFPSVPDFLDEVRRVLDAGGRGIIIDNLAPEDRECDRFLNEAERLRDPTHVRAYSQKMWLVFLADAGLGVLSSSTFQRTHDFGEWARRTCLAEKDVLVLEERFLKAPLKVRRHFRVKTDDHGKMMSYTDEKGIFVVRK